MCFIHTYFYIALNTAKSYNMVSIVLYITVLKNGAWDPISTVYFRSEKFYVCRPDDDVNYTPKHVAIWALICKMYIQ
jgi:hypothetical protein